MERLQQAVAKMLPHLQIKLHSSEVLNEDETVFLFSSSEEIEPLYTMLKSYGLKVEIDKVEKWQFLFIFS
jgi:hypothetical protein